jgi:enterobacterial common antigen flippase
MSNVPDDSSAGDGAHRIAGPTVAYWLATMVALAGSLARGKIFAISLGTDGVGVLAQLANFAALLTGLSTLGLTTAGMTLLGREHEAENADRRQRIMSTIVWLPVAMSLVLAAAAAAASEPLSSALLGSTHHQLYVVLAAASVPANALANSYQAVLQGLRRAWRTAWNSAISAVAMVVIVVLLVVPFGLTGGAISVVLTSVAAAAVVLIRERAITRDVLPPRMEGGDTNRVLLHFGVASLVAGSATALVDLALRSALVHRDGAAANGIYQPVYLLGTLVFAQLGAGIVTAVTPGLAAAWQRGDKASTQAQIRGALHLSLLAMVPLILVGMALRTVLIEAVFSHSFVSAAPVLALALTAELPRAVAYACGGLLLPAGRVRTWVGMGVSAETVRLAVGLALLGTLGVRALAVATLADWVIMSVVTLVTVRQLGIRIDRKLSYQLVFACVVVGAAYASTRIVGFQWLVAVILIMAAIGWLQVLITPGQRRSAKAVASTAVSMVKKRSRET